MKWISFCIALLWVILLSVVASADAPPSYGQIHPITWMHQIPTGEQPGWANKNWFNYEVNEANIWAVPMTMIDLRNGNIYNYESRFEQSSVMLEAGHAFSSQFAASLVVPYANRWGGFMDHIINAYHETVWRESLFERDLYPQYQNVFSVTKNGKNFFENSRSLNGVSNLDLKMKWWLWRGTFGVSPKKKPDLNRCACGFAISSQTKFPTDTAASGGTTGYIDQSIVLHFGQPILERSAAWFTLSYTFLGKNPALEDWPTYDHTIMYEFNFDFAIDDKWGFITNHRMESPILNVSSLQYYNTAPDAQTNAANKESSGWNALVRWVGSESIGLRYKPNPTHDYRLMFVENWAIGPYSNTGSVYRNNAPEIALVMQGRVDF